MTTFVSLWLAALACFLVELLLGRILHRGGSGFREWHHGYLSVPIGLVGLLLHVPALVLVAAVLAVDDAEGHLVGVALNDAAYQSPFKRLWYGSLGAWPPLLKLGTLLDRLLGKRG